ncbi:MAG: acylphosphatase [Chloroflexi bacterium]|nr:MAG: acylphosphatase [Chloroflexota bacterium]
MSDDPARLARLHAVVHGDVQGVGFRAHTQREAARLKLTGWVRNVWDGTVETVAEGPRHVLEQFEFYLHRGPSAAIVEHVDVTYDEPTGEFHGFHIRY